MLSVSILHGALETYVKGVKSTQRATSPRASTFLALSQRTAVNCVEQLLWILGLCEGLAGDTVEQSLVLLETVNTRSNEEEVAGARLEVESESNTLSGYCQKASNFCVFRHF